LIGEQITEIGLECRQEVHGFVAHCGGQIKKLMESDALTPPLDIGHRGTREINAISQFPLRQTGAFTSSSEVGSELFIEITHG